MTSYNEACVMNDLFTKHGNHRIQKINDFEFRLEKNEKKGMNVPVTIFSDDILISKMVSDRTIDQAANVARRSRGIRISCRRGCCN